MSHYQTQSSYIDSFINELRLICAKNRRQVRFGRVISSDSASALVTISIVTGSMVRRAGGLPVQSVEEVIARIPSLPIEPPQVWVDHFRFVGYPHVLQGCNLCIYLDPHRDWDPLAGAGGFMQRIFDWFRAAVSGQFDAASALFHPVGGVLHETPGAPMVVLREELPPSDEISIGSLIMTTTLRYDLTWQPNTPNLKLPVMVIRVSSPLSVGAGSSLGDVLGCLSQSVARDALERLKLLRHHVSKPKYLYFVLTVPYKELDATHLLAGRVSAGLLERISYQDIPVEWCLFSDERPSVTTRRDKERPMHEFHGKKVMIVGVGGIGSWIAEFVVRASPVSVLISDIGTVRGGLLVRQNFVDSDVGNNKASALVKRLQSINPTTTKIEFVAGSPSIEILEEFLSDEDAVVIDASISIPFGRTLDEILVHKARRSLVAQVVTDVATGSKGMVVVLTPNSKETLLTLDELAGKRVLADGQLEDYHTFWKPELHRELIPTLGCSVPTYHGSAADLAAVAGEHLNFIGSHIGSQTSAVHLFALPHSRIQMKKVSFTANSLY